MEVTTTNLKGGSKIKGMHHLHQKMLSDNLEPIKESRIGNLGYFL